MPIVFLDMPGDNYWSVVKTFIEQQLLPRGLVTEADVGLFLVTDDSSVAVREILHFYANYLSLRYVGDQLVIRLRRSPDDAQLAELNDRFGHLCREGRIERSGPLTIELREQDALDLERIRFTFARHSFAELRGLIDALNGFVDD